MSYRPMSDDEAAKEAAYWDATNVPGGQVPEGWKDAPEALMHRNYTQQGCGNDFCLARVYHEMRSSVGIGPSDTCQECGHKWSCEECGAPFQEEDVECRACGETR